MNRTPRIAAAVPVIFALLFALWRGLGGDPASEWLADRANDLRFVLRGPRPAPDDVVLVAIDEATVDAYGWSPPPRAMIARLIETVLDDRPAVLAVDLLFIDPTGQDAPLAAAIARGDDRIVLGVAASFTGPPQAARSSALHAALARSALTVAGGTLLNDTPPRLFAPNDAFLPEATLAQVNLIRESDGAARRAPLAEWLGGDVYLPSLALAAAARLRGVLGGGLALRPGRSLDFGGHSLVTDSGAAVLINPYGGPGAIRTYDARSVLDGALPAGALAGRAVFLGVTAESLSDIFATPFGDGVAGSEVLATLAANIASDTVMVRDARTRVADVVLAVVLATGLGLAGASRRRQIAVAGALALWGAGFLALQIPFAARNIVLDAPSALFALVVATLWAVGSRMRRARLQSAELARHRDNLARYVPPSLAEGLARSATPAFDRRSQIATVLFVDVAGYTTISEFLGPEEVGVLMRGLHGAYEGCASAERGVVLNFIGDGALIAFGLPEPASDDAARALDCGRALLGAAAGLHPPGRPEEALRLRVSIHTGEVIAGLAGSTRQAQVTMSGDTVNVASRLQDVAKDHGKSFVVSRAVIEAARLVDRVTVTGFEPLATAPIRGRVAPVETWALRA